MESLLSTEPNFENDVCETHSWGMLVRSRDEGFKAMTMPSARLRESVALRGIASHNWNRPSLLPGERRSA
nr:hypothetical protein [Escherichia coli]